MKSKANNQKATHTTEMRRRRRIMTGEVVRRSGDKTVAVAVARVERHPLYRKRRTLTTTHLAHDPQNEVQVGDIVKIEESRPLSARKRWVVIERTAQA